jgi:hypothetical protein
MILEHLPPGGVGAAGPLSSSYVSCVPDASSRCSTVSPLHEVGLSTACVSSVTVPAAASVKV